MHILAYYYHWDLYTLWSISRRERAMWVKMVHEQIEAENNASKPDKTGNKDSSSTYKESSDYY